MSYNTPGVTLKYARRIAAIKAMCETLQIIPVTASATDLDERLKLCLACNYLNPKDPAAAYRALTHKVQSARKGNPLSPEKGKLLRLRTDCDAMALTPAEEDEMRHEP